MSREDLPIPTEEASHLAFEALNQSGCGALVADNEAKIVYVNQRLCEITGYDRDELLGQNPKMLQSGNTPRETYLSLWNTVSSGRPWHGVLQNRKKNGDLYWEAITISPLKNTAGAITHFSAILEDVTDEKLIETARSELEEEIFQEEKREGMTALALGMAHDLNNSLSCVLAACNLARKAQDNPQTVSEMFDVIESSAKRSADFVHQMTTLWKPSLPQLLTMDAQKVLSSYRAHYEKILPSQTLSWKAGDSPLPIVGSPALIHEAVLALLTNAREAAPGSPVELSCGSVSQLKPEADEFFIPCGLSALSVVYIEVKDDGAGMDTYTLRRAFNPFFSAKSGQKGLGLATVYGIMTSHKGAIGVISSPGKGTRMRLYFRKMP